MAHMEALPAHISVAQLVWIKGEGAIPEGAVEGGYRGNKAPYYVGRVLAPDGVYHPAKVFKSDVTGLYVAHYCYDDKETESPTYETLAQHTGHGNKGKITEWVKASDGKVPAHAVQGERNKLYIGRHLAETELVVGEVNTEEGQCIVVTCWKVFKFSEYEILCAFSKHKEGSTE